MQHGQTVVKRSCQPHTSGLEGRHDEGKRSRVPLACPAVALPQRGLSSAPSATFLDLGTRLPLDVEELLMPLLDGGTRPGCGMVGRAPVLILVPGRHERMRLVRVSPIGSDAKCYRASDPCFLRGQTIPLHIDLVQPSLTGAACA